MKWFEGPITSAIVQAKQRKSLFVVYIKGTNEDSEKMTATWDADEVSKMCEAAGLVVMMFDANSDECKQFSVYYPVICVPCVYLISGETGTLLESIGGFAAPQYLVQKIQKVMQAVKVAPASSSTSQQPTQAAATSPPPPAAAEPVPQASTSSTSSSLGNAHERAARMRQKMEEVHRKKEQQRREMEKQKEIDRRKSGQQMQKADQNRSEMQARQLADDLRKQKREDKLAREKVLAQLERDKAEKNARFQSEREQRDKQKMQAMKEKEAAQREEQARREAAQNETARIQFRLPDGSTMTNQFSSSALFQEAQDFVTENIGQGLPEFTLSQTYPRKNFGPDDMQKSFLDLGLAPRAAIVVLPGKLIPTTNRPRSQQVSQASNGGFLSWLFAPFLFIYNLLYTVILGTPAQTAGPIPTPAPRAQADSTTTAATPTPSTSAGGESSAVGGERSFREAGARPKSSYARRRTPGAGNADTFSRQEGNVHRINTQQGEDDENNTWNGNSTQQM